MKKVTTHEAKTHLSRLLGDVEAGVQVVICRGDRPVARLVRVDDVEEKRRPRVGEVTSGPVTYCEDAFAPLNEVSLAEWGL